MFLLHLQINPNDNYSLTTYYLLPDVYILLLIVYSFVQSVTVTIENYIWEHLNFSEYLDW